MNKKGYSTGFTWIFGLVSLFGLGILYIVFNQVLTTHLVPIIKDQMTSSGTVDNATITEVNDGIDRYMIYFNILPFVLFFTVIVYMIIAAVRKEGEGGYV